MTLKILYTIPEDYPERWKRWTRRLRGKGSQRRVKVLRIADKVLVVFFVLLYILLGWGCANSSPGAVIGYIASTAVCFVIVSLWRRKRNAPRPYQMFDIKPLVSKDTPKQGESFPSRHAFCAFLVGTMALIIFRSFFGFLCVALAAVLGYLRVLEGRHFPRDIFAGALLGIVSGLICSASFIVGLD